MAFPNKLSLINTVAEFHPISYTLITNQIPLSLHLPVFGIADRFCSGSFYYALTNSQKKSEPQDTVWQSTEVQDQCEHLVLHTQWHWFCMLLLVSYYAEHGSNSFLGCSTFADLSHYQRFLSRDCFNSLSEASIAILKSIRALPGREYGWQKVGCLFIILPALCLLELSLWARWGILLSSDSQFSTRNRRDHRVGLCHCLSAWGWLLISTFLMPQTKPLPGEPVSRQSRSESTSRSIKCSSSREQQPCLLCHP